MVKVVYFNVLGMYLLLTLVLDSLYHRLISMPPEMSMARPPWNSALAFRPDWSWMTWKTANKKKSHNGCLIEIKLVCKKRKKEMWVFLDIKWCKHVEINPRKTRNFFSSLNFISHLFFVYIRPENEKKNTPDHINSKSSSHSDKHNYITELYISHEWEWITSTTQTNNSLLSQQHKYSQADKKIKWSMSEFSPK